jgi:hypothetical protein
MPSLYDVIADSCAALAAKAKHKSDKVQLLQLADQWRTVPAHRQGPGKKPPASVVPVTDNVNRATLLSRQAPQGRRLESASDEIEERNKQLESKTERAKKEAVERARDAIGVLRELGIDVDMILKDHLGLATELKPARPGQESSPTRRPVQCATPKQTLLMTEERIVVRARKSPLRPENPKRRD